MDLKRYITTLPKRYQNLAEQVLSPANTSKAKAIKLKCVDCMGYEDTVSRIKACCTVICPLHAIRPYQTDTPEAE